MPSDEQTLNDFLQTLGAEYSKSDIEYIKPILDVNNQQTFTKKMLILQWYFYQGSKMATNDQDMYNFALSQKIPDGMIQRFHIPR